MTSRNAIPLRTQISRRPRPAETEIGANKRYKGPLDERRATIGRRLRHAREAKGLSQAELGRIVGCSKSHVSQIEGAMGTYSFKIFLAICDALEVDPAFMFAGVPARELGELYARFERSISHVGAEAVDFLSSLGPDELQLFYARAMEAVLYQRSLQQGHIRPPKFPDPTL